MNDRLDAAKAFARANGADVQSIVMVAGDASNRKYYRLLQNGRSVILMDAPPAKGEDVRPFVKICTFLTSTGFSAPIVHAVDEDSGFLLLEDLGDDLFGRLLEAQRADERILYQAAVDVLLELHLQTPPKLETYDSITMSKLAGLSVEWYRTGVTGSLDVELREGLETEMQAHLAEIDDQCTVLIQRDYHAENLLWLPERDGIRRVGLLDFQDAMLGHPAYDLVSILQDARRDVSTGLAVEMRDAFIAASGSNRADFLRGYHLLGLQRNLRILGVFARLSRRDKKPSYVDLIPRVWGHIETNLDALNESGLSNLVRVALPEPNEERLTLLRKPIS